MSCVYIVLADGERSELQPLLEVLFSIRWSLGEAFSVIPDV